MLTKLHTLKSHIHNLSRFFFFNCFLLARQKGTDTEKQTKRDRESTHPLVHSAMPTVAKAGAGVRG